MAAEKVSFFDEVEKNKTKSLLLAAFVFSFLVAFIYLIALIFFPEFTFVILIFAIIFVSLYTYSSYKYGDRVVLSATKAKPADPKQHAYLINAVEGLAIAAGIPKPAVYVMPSDDINAFATGSDPAHASIAVTTGALENLKRDELEGVVGHEISHIRNFDIRFATVVAVMVGLIAIISHMILRSFRFSGSRDDDRGRGSLLIIIGIVLAIFAPLIVRLVQLAISRKREFMADASSAQLTRYPEGLADALEKIMKTNEGKMNVSESVSHLFIADPNSTVWDRLYATHPPLKERIKILRSM
jgi:heat shock protein HtpX